MAEESKILVGGGISVPGGIDIAAIGNVPLDLRLMVKSPEGLEELKERKRVYDGMLVYSESNQAYYKANVAWDSQSNITSCVWTEVVISSEEELKTLIASQTTAAMEFKGVINNGTLPTSAQKGDMYKIVTTNLTLSADNNAETVSESVTIQPGDSIVYEGDHKWYHIPSGDDIEDTWRPQIWDGVQLNPRVNLNVVEGNNIDINANADGTVTINAVDTDTHHQAKLVFTDSEEGTECKTVDSNDSLFLNLVEGPDNAKEVRSAHKIVIEEHSPITITNQTADPDVENSVDTLTIALQANSADTSGYVQAPDGAHKVWATNEDGVPTWLNEYEGIEGNPVIIDTESRIISHEVFNAPAETPSEETASKFIVSISTDGYGHIDGYTTAEVEIPDVTLDEASISRNEDEAIEIKGFADAAPLTLPQKKSDGTGIEWVTVDAVIEGAENTITVGDGTSIDTSTATVAGGDIVLEIKGVRDAKNKDKLLSTDGAGNALWVAREDIDTVVTVKDGDGANKGIKVTKATTPENGADVTYEIAHEQAPATGTAATDTAGTQGTYVTEVLVDEFGHVAGVKTAADKDTIYDLNVNADADSDYVTLDFYQDNDLKQSFPIRGTEGTKVTLTNNEIQIQAPRLNIATYGEIETPSEDVVAVIKDLEQPGDGGSHDIGKHFVYMPTKEYVDRLVTGATDYLGTVSSYEELDSLKAKRGDFVRVAAEFTHSTPTGDLVTYHASDMLICETDAQWEDDQITTVATWSVIHGEIDANTWIANSKDADGYVTKGEGHANQVWKTDVNGNPGWHDDQDTTYTADEVSLTLDETEFSIKDGGVSTEKIANEAVTTEKIADLSVIMDKLDPAIQSSLIKVDNSVQYVELIELVDPQGNGSGEEYDDDTSCFTTGFTVRVGKDEQTYKDTTFRLFTEAKDGIIFYPNEASEGSLDDEILQTGISLSDWARGRILNSVSNVTTTAEPGLRVVTTCTYTNDKYEEVTVTPDELPEGVVDFRKNTSIEIDDNVTFVLNCGTAADL